MDKDKIIEYVMNTPGNTNPAVLGSMVDSISGSGGGVEQYMVQVQILSRAGSPVTGCNLRHNGVTVSADDLYSAKQSGKLLTLMYPAVGYLDVQIYNETNVAQLAAHILEPGDEPSTLEYTLIQAVYVGSSTAPVDGAVVIDTISVSASNTYPLVQNESAN